MRFQRRHFQRFTANFALRVRYRVRLFVILIMRHIVANFTANVAFHRVRVENVAFVHHAFVGMQNDVFVKLNLEFEIQPAIIAFDSHIGF